MRYVTDGELAYFKSRVRYWADRFGLGDWFLTVGIDRITEGAQAECRVGLSDAEADIRLAPYLESEQLTETNLNWTALHEVLHVVLEPWASRLQVSDGVKSAMAHRLIHRIMRALEVPDPEGGD